MSPKMTDSKISSIRPETLQMEALLAAGYPDIGTAANARQMLDERAKNPLTVPYEKAERAKAFLAAYSAKPVAIDETPGWKRKKIA